MNTRRALILLTLPVLLAAANTRPDDYAYGWAVQSGSPGDFQRLALPREVLAAAQSPQLADVAVFDDDDRPMPSFLVAPDLTPLPQPASVPVPLFETIERLQRDASHALLSVQAAADGSMSAQLSIGTDGAAPAPEPKRQWYATLDDAQRERDWSAAAFEWDSAVEPQVINLELAVSDDLQSWYPVMTGAIAYLVSGPATLKRDRIPLGQRLGRYLRVTALTAPAGWQLRSLALVPVADRAEPEREWADQAVPAGTETLDVDLGGAIGIDRFDLVLDHGVGLVRARLASADQAGGPWTPRSEALFYRLPGSAIATSSPAAIAPVSARHWRVELIGHDGQPARLRLGWLPTDLVFLAQGQPPYRLVAGHAARAAAAHADPEQRLNGDARMLWSSSASTGVAALGPRQELAGERALRMAETRDWRSWLLWSLLGLGVLAVLWMAAQLLREMKRG